MVILELRFPGGRFHATPWGRHVNEGVPEWPPSPFRLLRALYDTWRRKAPDISVEIVEPLFGKLASNAPDFALPPARASHTRSYLRQDTEDETDKSLVFDPFVLVGPDEPARIRWPSIALSESESRSLGRLLETMNYFGRSESLVIASLGAPTPDDTWNCRPIDRGEHAPVGEHEIVQVACVAPPGAHLALELKSGKTKRVLDWLEALTWGSSEAREHRLSDPPALRWVSYRLPRRALDATATPARATTRRRASWMLFAFSGKVLPLITDTIAVAERFRMKAMGASKFVKGSAVEASPLLRGKDREGRPLEGHRHAYFLPLDRDGDGRIDHLLVRCADGIDRDDQLALSRITSIWQRRGRGDVQVVWVGSEGPGAQLEKHREWTSTTPFVTSRHHRSSLGSFDQWIEGELRRALKQEGLPAPKSVRPLGALLQPNSGRSTRWIQFGRARKNDSPRPGYGFCIEFTEPVPGPFAVGYGSHFGLGAFSPVPKRLDPFEV